MLRFIIAQMKIESARTKIVIQGMPMMRAVAKSASDGGGFMRMPWPVKIAVESTTKLEDRVAMMGGMRSRRMRP
jgi:hypothetical protein